MSNFRDYFGGVLSGFGNTALNEVSRTVFLIPGLISFAFRPVQNELRKYSDEEGQSLIQELIDLNEPFDSAVNKGDMERAVQIIKLCVPIVHELVPHLKTQRHRDLFTDMANDLETKVQEKNIQHGDLIKFGLKHLKYTTEFFGLPFPPRSN